MKLFSFHIESTIELYVTEHLHFIKYLLLAYIGNRYTSFYICSLYRTVTLLSLINEGCFSRCAFIVVNVSRNSLKNDCTVWGIFFFFFFLSHNSNHLTSWCSLPRKHCTCYFPFKNALSCRLQLGSIRCMVLKGEKPCGINDYCCMSISTPQTVYFHVHPFGVYTKIFFGGVFLWTSQRVYTNIHLKECTLTHTLKGCAHTKKTVQPFLERISSLCVFSFGAFNG